MKNIFLIAIFVFNILTSSAQQNKLVSGPWAGNVGIRTATIWAEVSPAVKKVSVKYISEKTGSIAKVVFCKTVLGNDFNPVKIVLNGLDFNTTYNYKLFVDDKEITTDFITKFTTQDLWQYRKPAPDFSFLAGR